MYLFWLRVSLVLYSLGLMHALLTLVLLRRARLFRVAFGAFTLGAIFHLVALVEQTMETGHLPGTSFADSVSLLAFGITCTFLLVYWRYKFQALSVFTFPLVFMLMLPISLGRAPRIEDPLLKSGWLFVHIGGLMAGYAMLAVTFVAGLMYILQERELKSKKPRGLFHRLPPLEQLDDIAHKTLALGFPFLTVGLISGAIWATTEWGSKWALDPKMALSFVSWLIYLALIFTRWTVGWRGRKAAYFAIAGFFATLVTWSANSGLHSFK